MAGGERKFAPCFFIGHTPIFGNTFVMGITMNNFCKLLKNSKGATAIEYGLIAALIAVAAVAAMGTLGNKIALTMNNSANDMKVS